MNALADAVSARAPVRPGAQLYIDSPMPNALDQVLPFYRNGFLPSDKVPVFMRRQSRRDKVPELVPGDPLVYKDSLRRIVAQQATAAGVVYYAFNSQTNITLVSNRDLRHVLILHGESNKIASFRAAARLYDYVLVAGELACRRYQKAGIFTQWEIDRGRLIKMGDSVVQSMPYFVPAAAEDDAWLLYAPTWETSSIAENYSSAEGGVGFAMIGQCARAMGLRRIIVKPHPNFGMRDKQYLRDLVSSVRRLSAEGLTVRVFEEGLNWRAKLALRILCGASVFADPGRRYPIAFALVDVSGMEAICLKQGIAHMVVRKSTNAMPLDAALDDIYRRKSFDFGEGKAETQKKLMSYFAEASVIDGIHRGMIFSYTEPSLIQASAADRYAWLDGYIRNDSFWSTESY